MKYIEAPRLSQLTSMLTNYELGDRVINGRVEAYSCKRTNADKRLSRILEQQYTSAMTSRPSCYVVDSPLGPMSESSTRQLLCSLISTLNNSYPDWDFADLRPEEFTRAPSLQAVMQTVNVHLAELIAGHGLDLMETLWGSVDEQVDLRECEIFSYLPSATDDNPFSESTLWSFNYFFFSRARNRIVLFTCVAQSRFAAADALRRGSLGYDSELESEYGSDSDGGGGGYGSGLDLAADPMGQQQLQEQFAAAEAAALAGLSQFDADL